MRSLLTCARASSQDLARGVGALGSPVPEGASHPVRPAAEAVLADQFGDRAVAQHATRRRRKHQVGIVGQFARFLEDFDGTVGKWHAMRAPSMWRMRSRFPPIGRPSPRPTGWRSTLGTRARARQRFAGGVVLPIARLPYPARDELPRTEMGPLVKATSSRICCMSSHPERCSAGVVNFVQMSRSERLRLFMPSAAITNEVTGVGPPVPTRYPYGRSRCP